MNIEFFYTIAILAMIYFILVSGFKFFLNLKGQLDFSYLAIVVFGAYTGVILNNLYSTSILFSIFFAFLLSTIFTVFILFLSSKLSEVYFVIGTLSLYILSTHLARNLEITGGAMGISIGNRNVIGSYEIVSNEQYFYFCLIISVIIIIILLYIKRTLFYKTLTAWGEQELVIKALGIKVNIYKLFMILITSFLAVVGANLYSFNFMYISPSNFWLPMLSTILIISLISYKFKEIATIIISFLIILSYEYLRFAKIVDPTNLGYIREILFSLLVMIISFIIFKKSNFGREI